MEHLVDDDHHCGPTLARQPFEGHWAHVDDMAAWHRQGDRAPPLAGFGACAVVEEQPLEMALGRLTPLGKDLRPFKNSTVS